MSFLLFIELVIITFFFIMFYRRSNLVWAVGLLTASTAVLLNVALTIFGNDVTLDSLGLWGQILGGLAFGGAAFWLWGLLQPNMSIDNSTSPSAFTSLASKNGLGAGAVDAASEQLLSKRAAGMRNDSSEYDRHLLFDQIKKNLGPEDILDLLFDLEFAENEVIAPTKDMNQTIINIMDMANENELMGDLALAVVRILTAVPPDHFPRLSRITVESP